jgi:hypothetical protein
MKAKQLPGSLDEWLKTPTVVIGGVNWLEANLHVPAQRARDKKGKPERSSFAKAVDIHRWSKLVPLFKFRPRGAVKESMTQAQALRRVS